MDELIEAFSVINQMEKGALGLFFELNYLIGLFLTVYITWFVNANKPPTAPKDASAKMHESYKHMYMWLYVNYIYLYISLFMSIVVACLFRSMDNKAKNIKQVSGG